MGRILPRIRIAAALAAVAVVAAGCAAANNTASSQGEQPYKAAYGTSSAGNTTDLYTEIFGPRQPPPAPATTVASTQPTQPVTAQPITPVQQPMASSGAARQGQAATAPNRQGQTAANRTPQPAPVQPVQVAQQPAPPPPEPDVPTSYGITASGPTTDLYTEIFGPRRRDGQ